MDAETPQAEDAEGNRPAAPASDHGDQERAPKPKGTSRKKGGLVAFWETHKKGLVPAAVVLVLAQIWTPVGGFVLDSLDELRDAARYVVSGYDAAQVDDMKEQVDAQDYWVSHDPQWLGKSLDFASQQGNVAAPVVSTDSTSGRQTILSPAELVRNGRQYDGEPVILVGKVMDSQALSGDSAHLVTHELRLVGKANKPVAIVGMNPFGGDAPAVGAVRAFPGVIVATGRVELDSGETLRTVYFLGSEPYDDPASPIRQSLKNFGEGGLASRARAWEQPSMSLRRETQRLRRTHGGGASELAKDRRAPRKPETASIRFGGLYAGRVERATCRVQGRRLPVLGRAVSRTVCRPTGAGPGRPRRGPPRRRG
jgi:hypothetical protein